jgi:hypothetical protein
MGCARSRSSVLTLAASSGRTLTSSFIVRGSLRTARRPSAEGLTGPPDTGRPIGLAVGLYRHVPAPAGSVDLIV